MSDATDAEAAASSAETDKPPPSINELILQTSRVADLWHTPDGEAWASVGSENWPIASKQFERWLIYKAHDRAKRPVTRRNAEAVIDTIAAQAVAEGETHRVHVRVAPDTDVIWIDLADGTGKAARVSAAGWAIERPPVKFYRPERMEALPLPSAGQDRQGVMEELRRTFRLDEADFPLFLSALTADLRPKGPYPIVIFNGAHGSGKSTLVRMFRAFVDPSGVSFGSLPRDERDLAALIKNRHLIGFDNVSHIPPAMADTLCMLSTGGGFGGRALYTNYDEATFSAQRPIILNGIPELALRADLADRSLIFRAPPLDTSAGYLPEDAVWAQFNNLAPKAFGAILDCMVEAMARLPDVRGRVHALRLPRMADFAEWGVAIAPSLGWSEQDFLAAHRTNRLMSDRTLLEGDAFASVLIDFVRQEGHWEGSATQLLQAVRHTRNKPWGHYSIGAPSTPEALGAWIDRMRGPLGAGQIGVERDRKSDKRVIRLWDQRAAEAAVANHDDGANDGAAKEPVMAKAA